MIVRSKFIQLLSVATLAVVVFLPSLPIGAEEVVLDRIVAIVQDDVVMDSELESRTRDIYARLEESGTAAPPRDVLVPQVLDRLILERLQLIKGQRVNIRISDADLNQALENAAQRQGTTVDSLTEKAHQRGVTLASLRHQMRNEMIIAKVQEGSINRRISITEQDIDNFLSSEEGRSWLSPDVNLGHILLSLSAGAPRDEVANIEQKIRDIYNQIQNGADFKSLAVANSMGQNALSGGDLGWRKTAQLPSIFIAAIENLSPGQISEPIRSDAGYHLLKLYDQRGARKQMVLQHKVRHILLTPNEIRDDEATREAINNLRVKILNGSDFAEIAREYSEDIATSLSGGELGWSVPGQFVPTFEKTMSEIEIDQVSEPFQSQFGWHILQVTERRKQDFSEDIQRSQAHNILKRRKFDEELEIWLKEIRDEAFIDIKL
ncbi:MAG: peptidylprolyl isomerase [Porticoccus sp.]